MQSILSWNINGLRALIKKKEAIEYITKNSKKYDLLAFQEIKLNGDSVNVLQDLFTSFPFVFASCTKNSRSGVAVFSKIKPISVEYDMEGIYDMGKKDPRYAGRVVCVEFEKYYYINVYQPNSGEKLKNLSFRNEFDTEFKKYITKRLKKKKVVVSGDFNAVKGSEQTWNYKKQLNKVAGVTKIEIDNFNSLLNDLKLSVASPLNAYTYFSYRFVNSRSTNHGMTVDYVIISKGVKVKSSKILNDLYGSDHLAMTCTFKV